MDDSKSQRGILQGLQWPNREHRLREHAQAVQALTPEERLDRVDALSRLCLELAAAGGNLEAARRYREQREAEWRRRIGEVIRQHERRSSKSE